MKVKKLNTKISVFLIFMLIFWLAGSSFIYASDTEPNSDAGGPPGLLENIFDTFKSFMVNMNSLFNNNDTVSAGENGQSESKEGSEEDADNGHNFGEEISGIAQGLGSGDF